jgi:hypothetical protein
LCEKEEPLSIGFIACFVVFEGEFQEGLADELSADVVDCCC